MRPERRETGFGLVAAMFLIVIVALVIAAMARLAVTQNATTSMAIQQARAYQAARAGIEYGIARVLGASPNSCNDDNDDFEIDGFSISIGMTCHEPVENIEEEGRVNVLFFEIRAKAEYGLPGSADYAYRQLTVVVEIP